jgi:hypothetical protein
MPYKVYKVGEKYCVHKKKPDGSRGKKIGCHSSQSAARQQQEALYAAEGKKEIPMSDLVVEEVPEEEAEQEEQETKEKTLIEKGYIPWGVTSFADLEKAREAEEMAEKTFDLLSDYTGLVSNIISSSEIEDKAAAVEAVTGEMQSLLKSSHMDDEDDEKKETDDFEELDLPEHHKPAWEKFKSWFKQMFETEEQEQQKQQFYTWKKKDGTMRWLAVYSNKFRDEDKPTPEIISEKSHLNFIELVDTKQADMPELWLWHVPEWKYGVADWLAWDDAGFAVASGTIDHGKEAIAEWVGEQSDVAVSHGMPNDSIVYDPEDPSVIVSHVTKELSTLPYWAAANKRTDWFIMGDASKSSQEDDMAIPEEKKNSLIKDWNADPKLLKDLEEQNADKADKALAEGVDFKETEEEEAIGETGSQEAEQTESTEVTEPVEETPATETEYPTREEVAEGVAEALTPILEQQEELAQTVKSLVEVVTKLTETDEEKITKATEQVPSASIAAMIGQNLGVTGGNGAEVGEDEESLKEGPRQTDPNKEIITGTFLDDFVLGRDRQKK